MNYHRFDTYRNTAAYGELRRELYLSRIVAIFFVLILPARMIKGFIIFIKGLFIFLLACIISLMIIFVAIEVEKESKTFKQKHAKRMEEQRIRAEQRQKENTSRRKSRSTRSMSKRNYYY